MMNNLTRERRERTYGIISLAVLAIMLLACLMVFSGEIMLSLKKYNAVKGILGSSWVGLENFKALFSSMVFARVLQNTIVFNLLFAVIGFGIVVAVGYSITAIPRGSIVRGIIASFCILPVFLPAEVYSYWFIYQMGSGVFTNPGKMQFIHPLLSVIKYAGIPIMVLYILDEMYENKDFLLPCKVAGLFSLVSLAFIANACFSLTQAVYNPLIYETLDTLDTFGFRRGMMEMNISENAVLGIFQICLSLVSTILLFVPIRLLFSATFKSEGIRFKQESMGKRLVSSLLALVIFAVIYFLPYIFKEGGLALKGVNLPIGSSILTYIMISVASAFIATILAAVMSMGVVSIHRGIRWSSIVLLAIITLLTMRPTNISYYLLLRGMGIVNTGIAVLVATCFSTAAAWAIACVLKTEKESLEHGLVLAMAGVFFIQTALTYINSTAPLLYVKNPSISPVSLFKQMSAGMQNMSNAAERASFYSTMGFYGFILSMPSLLFFLAANTVLPKRYLLAVISGGIKS